MKEPIRFTRREFVNRVAAGVATLPACAGDIAGQGRIERIIDCHAHIYGEDEKKYPTIAKPYRPPAGKGTLRHLQREMQDAGVSHVTAIHTSTFYRWDNRFTVDSARVHRDFMVAVCTLDPDNPESARILQDHVTGGGVRGLRSIPGKSGRLDDPGVDRLWAKAESLGIVINVLISRDKRKQLESLVARHSNLPVVIDHCLNLKAGPEMAAALDDLVGLARFPTLHAKLTFVPTGSAEEYPFRDMHSACHTIISAFGPDRCVWGSDFPCELWCPKVTYKQHLRIFSHELDLDEQTRRKILGETAHRLWFEPLRQTSRFGERQDATL